MATPQVSKEGLKAIASMSGLRIDDESLNELLPQIQHASESMARLDSLGLKDVEPAIVFTPQTE